MRRLALDDGVYQNRIYLSEEEALQMELALNASRYGRAWRDVGDRLFHFHFYAGEDPRPMVVAPTQLRVLRRLLCRRGGEELNANPQEAS